VGVKQSPLTTLRAQLDKIGAKIARHSRSVTYQLAVLMISCGLFRHILGAIAELRSPPPA